MNPARILVADDKENIVRLFQRILEHDFHVTTAADGTRALAALESDSFDVVITDIRMPGHDGLEILREVKRTQPETEVILMTAFGSVQSAVEAIKEGAYDYLTKPFEPDEALLIVQRAVERKRLREQARDLRSVLAGSARFADVVAKSPAMHKVLDLLARAAESTATVLVSGESGTGKEVVSRAIHLAGPRRERRFVPVNCGAIPEALMESELFGHLKGAFTGAVADKRGLFEEADGGTLLLDEIGELPLGMQVKLTRALQERRVRRVGAAEERKIDVRVIAASNVDLKAAVAAGKFREDLFYRLNVFPIHLPGLRERREDIPVLAASFLARHAEGRAIEGFTPEALSALMLYDWPGNVRELENAVERAIAVTTGSRIGVEDLPDEVALVGPHRAAVNVSELSYREVVDLARDRASRHYLVALMRRFAGNVTHAAEHASMERETLHRLLKKYGVRSDSFKERS